MTVEFKDIKVGSEYRLEFIPAYFTKRKKTYTGKCIYKNRLFTTIEFKEGFKDSFTKFDINSNSIGVYESE